jgi:hypothetical protein
MPGLCLTAAQAARLWGLTPGVCAEVLQTLVAEGALICTREARYVAAGSKRLIVVEDLCVEPLAAIARAADQTARTVVRAVQMETRWPRSPLQFVE